MKHITRNTEQKKKSSMLHAPCSMLYGFTLIELLVVIAIIGILTSIIVASFSAAQKNARDDSRFSSLKEIQVDLAQYYSAERSYPTTSGDNYASMLATLKSVLIDTGDLSATDPTGASYGYSSSNGTSYCVGAHLEGTIPSNNAGTSGQCASLSAYNYTQLPPQ